MPILEAIELHVPDPRVKEIVRRKTKTLSPEDEEAVAAYLGKNRETISKLHQAAELPRSRYPVDFSVAPFSNLPHISPVRDLAQLLGWEAINQTRLGNRAAAVQALRTGFMLTETLRREPTLISVMAGATANGSLISALESLLNNHQLTRKEIADLTDLFPEVEANHEQALQTLLVGELVLGKELFRQTHKQTEWQLGFDGLQYGLKLVVGLKQRDLAFFLETMHDYLNVATNRYPQIIQEGTTAERQAKAIMDGLKVAGFPTVWLSDYTLPPLEKIVKREAIFLAHLRCVQVILAIEEYRLTHEGRLPNTLSELAGEYLQKIPENPLDGTPLTYEKTEVGYQVAAPLPPELFEGWTATSPQFTISR